MAEKSTLAEPLNGLAAAGPARRSGPPPVHLWNPPFRGDLDIRIAADGSWHYLGSPIARERLVRLFASILRRDEDGRHYLVTPVEKIGIAVDDAPFLAVALSSAGAGAGRRITFRTNVGDEVVAGPEHPIRFELEAATDGLKPYVHVRGRLEALVSRALTFDLVDLGEERLADGRSRFGIWSAGVFFPITPLPGPAGR